MPYFEVGHYFINNSRANHISSKDEVQSQLQKFMVFQGRLLSFQMAGLTTPVLMKPRLMEVAKEKLSNFPSCKTCPPKPTTQEEFLGAYENNASNTLKNQLFIPLQFAAVLKEEKKLHQPNGFSLIFHGEMHAPGKEMPSSPPDSPKLSRLRKLAPY